MNYRDIYRQQAGKYPAALFLDFVCAVPPKQGCRQTQQVPVRARNPNHSQQAQTLLGLLAGLSGLRWTPASLPK